MENNSQLFSLSIDPLTKSELSSIANWSRFLAITGMIVLVLGLAASILGAAIFTDPAGTRMVNYGEQSEQINDRVRITMVIATIITCIIFFFPLYYLMLFANRMKRALATNGQNELNAAFLEMKKCFRFLGILTLIIFILYALVILLALMN